MTRLVRQSMLAAAGLIASMASTQAGEGTLQAPGALGEPGQEVIRPVDQVAPDDTESTSSAQSAPKPVLPDFQRGSGQKAGGPANELNTGEAKAPEVLPGGSVPNALTGRSLYHGNYCGHGNRGPGLPPTDELDAACMRHDACYDEARYRSCQCNITLQREAVAVANSPKLSRELRARAATVAEAAELMECRKP